VAWTEGTKAHWRARRSLASSHSGAQKLTGGGTTERGEHREPSSGLTGARAAAWQPSDGGEMTMERRLSNGGSQTLEEGESEMGEVWRSTGARMPIYRAGGRSAEGGNSVTADSGN
jgi:hypothetical protein